MVLTPKISSSVIKKPRISHQFPCSSTAIEDYSEAIRLNPQNSMAVSSMALLNRGNVYGRLGQHQRAIEDYNEAIWLSPGFALAFSNRGAAHAELGQHRRAIEDYNEAIRLDPRDAAPFNALAWLLATAADGAVRDGKRAVELAQRACELTEWKNPFYIDTLAAAYAEGGDFVEAVRRQEKVLQFPKLETSFGEEASKRLALYREGKPYRQLPRVQK